MINRYSFNKSDKNVAYYTIIDLSITFIITNLSSYTIALIGDEKLILTQHEIKNIDKLFHFITSINF